MIQELQTERLDINNKYEVFTTCKQGDNLKLKIIVYDKSLPADLSNYTCRLRAFKRDQTPLIQNTGITITNNTVYIECDEQLTTTAGIFKAELQFVNKTTLQKKSSFYIIFNVISSVFNVDGAVSTPTCTLLKQLENDLDRVENIGDLLEDAKDTRDDLVVKTDAANTSNENLVNSTSTADNTKNELDALNNNANSTKVALDKVNTAAVTNKNNLDVANVQAIKNYEALESLGDATELAKKVEQNSSQLNDMANINVLDYGIKGDGTTEDLSQLKELLKNKLINKTLLFPSNKVYKINEKIDVLADNCNIDILGTIILDNCDGINLQDVNNCTININKITGTKTYNVWHDYNNGKTEIDYSTFNNYALRLNNARNNRININTIHGLKQGIYLAPSQYNLNGSLSTSGLQYNEIHYGFLEACAYPIMFERLYGGTWANSNYFYGGMTSGYISIYMKTGTFDGDKYNQNVFYNIGAEYCKGGGFLLEEGKENAFYEFRHDKVDNYYIKTEENTKNNIFTTRYSGYLEGMGILGENNVIDMPNYKYSNSNDLISNKTIFIGNNKKVHKANLLNSNANNSTEAYCDNGEIPFTNFYKLIKDAYGNERVINQFSSFVSISSGILNITNKNMDNVFYLNTVSNDITVKFNESVEKVHYGHKFIFMTTGNFSSNHIPVFKDKNDSVISSLTGKINEAESLYCVIYIGGEYACYKIGTRK